MPRVSNRLLPAASLLVFWGAGCSLIPLQIQTRGFGESTEPTEQDTEKERAERAEEGKEQEREEDTRAEAMVADLASLRARIADGKDPVRDARSFAERVREARATQAARKGKIDVPALELEAVGYLEKALEKSPSLETFDLLVDVAKGPDADAAVLRVCPRVRPKVSGEDLPSFVGECLARADGDAKKLKWPSAGSDVAAYRKAEAERIVAESKAQEIEKKAQGKTARYVSAAVFAAGRCKFSNCLKDGWTASTPEGDVDVRCSFSNCMKDGWEAHFPDGATARTRCSFSNCMKDGWETSFADGTTARTRCSFSDCLKNGWETDLPGGETARTRCSFSDCSKDGWETDMPGGRHVQCRCNFSKCFEDGATCH